MTKKSSKKSSKKESSSKNKIVKNKSSVTSDDIDLNKLEFLKGDELAQGLKSLRKLYFSQPQILYRHLFSSYHQFIEEIIPYTLEKETHIFWDHSTPEKIYSYGFRFENTKLFPPVRERDNEIITPHMARKNFLNYFSNVQAKITQYQEVIDLVTNEKKVNIIGEPETQIIGAVPVMVKSKICGTVLKPEAGKYECKYDPGGYFIVNGQEKVIVSIEKMVDNKVLVFGKNDSSYERGKIYTAQINSRKHDWSDILQIIAVRNNKDDSLIITTSQFSEIPIMVFLRALGVESDQELVARITNNLSDVKMINILRRSLESSTDDSGNPIRTRDEAYDYLISKMKNNKRFSQSNEEIAYIQKRTYLDKILRKDFLPHLGEDLPMKITFLCMMVRKMLEVMMGNKPEDDRDAFDNKRVETPGVLLAQLFRQNFKKMLVDVGKLFRKKNNSDETPINVISSIKPTVIEQGIKTGLSTGIWGLSKTKKGVAQSLSRLTYSQTVSYYRRIKAPSLDTSTSKLTSIRHINNIQAFFVCNVETPEGANIGIIKSLSMMSSITSNLQTQKELLLEMIEGNNKLVHPFTIDPEKLDNYIKIFLDGKWCGCLQISDGLSFYENIKKMRSIGKIDKHVSIFMDYFDKEVKIFTEAGRLIRPILKVHNNRIPLTKQIIKDVESGEYTWNEILNKYPYLIEYEDIESSNSILSAMDQHFLDSSYENMNRKIKDSKSSDIIKPNRYGDTRFMRYTHAEFHPYLMFGSIVTNIPFINHNHSPRAVILFSQLKQAMGLYATNYKDRMDISNILYYPQIPLVTTEAMEYNGFLKLPSGENCIVAILSYTGMNQEDSVLISKNAIDRGLFRADSLKKYSSKIEKNPSTSQDDIFMKPDKNKVTGMTQGNYEKLNDEGYIPEETEINDKDMLIGKVSPIQPTGDNKVYKDKSEMFKSNVSGHVDRVHVGIYDNDGYEAHNIRVRMERKIITGDKLSTRFAQKGTAGLIVPQRDMPFTAEGIVPDIIFNPHGMPTRMTIGQLLETVAGKASANLGTLFDGTPFNENVKEIPSLLKKAGYEEYGTEEMYNGMTGRKMQARIFIGPVYYMRLKHMVLDKVHGRSQGPRQAITRQPLEGRAKDGGLKIGSMEKDSQTAHGIAQLLKETMMEKSDATTVHICGKCGVFAQKVIDKEYYTCPLCNESIEIHEVALPYACKLLFQELTSVNIIPRVRV